MVFSSVEVKLISHSKPIFKSKCKIALDKIEKIRTLIVEQRQVAQMVSQVILIIQELPKIVMRVGQHLFKELSSF